MQTIQLYNEEYEKVIDDLKKGQVEDFSEAIEKFTMQINLRLGEIEDFDNFFSSTIPNEYYRKMMKEWKRFNSSN